MTALDPRVGEIEARLAAATPGPWETTQAADEETTTWIEAANGDVLHHDERGYGHMRENFAWMKRADATFVANAPADVAFLLAELRKAHEALTRVEKVGRELFALSNTDDAYWTDQTRAVSRNAGQEIYMALRAAVAAAKGDERG